MGLFDHQKNMDAVVDEGLSYYNQGNYAKALELYHEAAAEGHPVAYHNISVCYYLGQGVPLNREEAFAWMKKAAEGGFAMSCAVLAEDYWNGDGVEPDQDEAIKWIQRAVQIEPNNMNFINRQKQMLEERSEVRAGEILLRKGMEFYQQGRYPESLRMFLKSAKKGNTYAMNNISVQYYNGQGMDINKEISFEWMQKAADGNNAGSCYVLANKYEAGEGTEKDLNKALEYAQKAVSLDSSNPTYAQYLNQLQNAQSGKSPQELVNEAAKYYQQGDMNTAFAFNAQAAELGNRIAMANLAHFYDNGLGVKKDINQSFEWMKKAADLNDAESCFLVAARYANGSGTPQNLKLALQYAERAVNLDPSNATYKERLEIIKREAALPQDVQAANLCDRGVTFYEQKKYEEAFDCFRQAAEMGNVQAMINLSVTYNHGQGTEKNPTAAYEWMKKAADMGRADACWYLGSLIKDGVGTEANAQEALKYYRKASQAEPNNRSYWLSMNALENKLKEPYEERIKRYLIDGADYEEVERNYKVGYQLWQNKSYKESLKWFMTAAKQGHCEALNYLGIAYYNGNGVQKDIHRASKFFFAAAIRGCDHVMTYFATRYSKGVFASPLLYYGYVYNTRYPKNILVETGLSQSGEWIREGIAEYNRVKHSKGPSGNYAEAEKYLRDAMAAGNPDAYCAYARILEEKGKQKEAVQYWSIAAFLGHSYALYQLGFAFESNPAVSQACFKEAAERGYQFAQYHL